MKASKKGADIGWYTTWSVESMALNQIYLQIREEYQV